MRPKLLVLVLVFADKAHGQSTADIPDKLLFTNGDQLTGSLEQATASGVLFKGLMTGEITVKWENIKELHSDRNFAILSANQKLTRRNAAAVVPQGPIQIENKEITVATMNGRKTVPVAEAARIIDAVAFEKAVNHPPGLLQGWTGTASAGVGFVHATQNATTFNGAIALVRATPQVQWLPPRNRTTLDYLQSYSTVSQARASTLKTNIFHAAAEEDEYFTSRSFTFASATFDHNFSQSLDLQQAYGVGLGLTLLRSAVRELNLKGDVHYEKERFFNFGQDQNLFGSTFAEKYLYYLPKGLVLNEFASISPSWNNTNAYSAHANLGLGFPVYRGIGFSIEAVDDYLNNAPIGSKKNSTQFTSGITYTIKAR